MVAGITAKCQDAHTQMSPSSYFQNLLQEGLHEKKKFLPVPCFIFLPSLLAANYITNTVQSNFDLLWVVKISVSTKFSKEKQGCSYLVDSVMSMLTISAQKRQNCRILCCKAIKRSTRGSQSLCTSFTMNHSNRTGKV